MNNLIKIAAYCNDLEALLYSKGDSVEKSNIYTDISSLMVDIKNNVHTDDEAMALLNNIENRINLL